MPHYILDKYPQPRIYRLWNRTRRFSQWLAYFLLICVSDAVDSIFWKSPYDKKLEDNPSESDQWDDAEILKRYQEATGFDDTRNGVFGLSPVKRISHDTVVKPATVEDRINNPPSEVQSISLVRSDTDILTPPVRRTITINHRTYILMEYVEARQLGSCWSSLSFWTQLRIARTLRQYIKQLQKIKHSHSHLPGPLSISPRRCNGYQFGYRPGGPFPDYASLGKHFNEYLRQAQRSSEVDPDTELFDDSKPLVFTHNDLNMRNILLGADGRVWLVDWTWSGFYPRWFEHHTMFCAAQHNQGPTSWKRLIPFIAGPHFKQMQWMLQLGFE